MASSYMRYDGVAQDTSGKVLPGAAVSVYYKHSGALATLYSDEVLTAKANPLTSSIDGSFWFYAADADYIISVTYQGNTTVLPDVSLRMEHIQYKTTQTDITNDVILTTDTDLSFPVLGLLTYYFRSILYVTTTSNANFAFRIRMSAGVNPPQKYCAMLMDSNGTTFIAAAGLIQRAYDATSNIGYGGNPASLPLVFEGFFIPSVDATFELQWCQGNTHADTTTVEENSFVYWKRVS